MKIIRKVLTNNIEPMIRAAIAEDIDFLKTYDGNLSTAFDLATKDFLSVIQPGDFFFKLENIHGAYIGFLTFSVPVLSITFYIRRLPFRSAEYLQAFWKLIDVTLNNNLFFSIGPENLNNLPDLLVNNFTVKNNGEYYGKNYIILKQIVA